MRVDSPAEQVLFTTVRIEADLRDGGMSTGTAFIVHWGDATKSTMAPFLVTNRHVIEGTSSGRFFFTEREGDQPAIGKRFDVSVHDFEQGWHPHPDATVDLAVLPFAGVVQMARAKGKNLFYKALSLDLIPSADQLGELDAVEEIVFVGYPNGVYDRQNLLPIVRRGATATPVQVDYNGQPVFLVDASVFPGSSGSPVLILNTGGYANRGGFTVGTRVLLLGVMSAVLYTEHDGRLEFVEIPTSKTPVVRTRELIDLGLVYKSRLIEETLRDFFVSKNLDWNSGRERTPEAESSTGTEANA